MSHRKLTSVAYSKTTHISEESFSQNGLPDIFNHGPFPLFKQWFEDAAFCNDISNPCAANLATVTLQGFARNRTITITHFDEGGFVFYSHKASRKCEEFERNPSAALCFFWDSLDRQIRAEGRIVPIRSVVTDAYFATMPKDRQVDAWGTYSSQNSDNFTSPEDSMAFHMRRYLLGAVPRPEDWIGFRVKPSFMEFWERGEQRIHKKLCFDLSERGAWQIQA